jgi:hypothetical protein
MLQQLSQNRIEVHLASDDSVELTKHTGHTRHVDSIHRTRQPPPQQLNLLVSVLSRLPRLVRSPTRGAARPRSEEALVAALLPPHSPRTSCTPITNPATAASAPSSAYGGQQQPKQQVRVQQQGQQPQRMHRRLIMYGFNAWMYRLHRSELMFMCGWIRNTCCTALHGAQGQAQGMQCAPAIAVPHLCHCRQLCPCSRSQLLELCSSSLCPTRPSSCCRSCPSSCCPAGAACL